MHIHTPGRLQENEGGTWGSGEDDISIKVEILLKRGRTNRGGDRWTVMGALPTRFCCNLSQCFHGNTVAEDCQVPRIGDNDHAGSSTGIWKLVWQTGRCGRESMMREGRWGFAVREQQPVFVLAQEITVRAWPLRMAKLAKQSSAET